MPNIDEILEVIASGITKINEAAPIFTNTRSDSAETASLLAQLGTETPSGHMAVATTKLGEVEQHLAAAVQGANEVMASVQAARGDGGLLTSDTGALPAPSARPRISHGVQQKRAGVMAGPVIFSAPGKGATPIETGQAKEYVDAANVANREGRLSPTGRVSLDIKAIRAKERAASRERERAEAAGEPYSEAVAAHLPDTTWVGRPDPPGGWGRHTSRVNSSLGAQSAQYPVGYRPTEFHLDRSWNDADPA